MATRTLHLTNPLMHGADVEAAQKLLNKHGYLASKYIDKYFGSHTGHACEVAKMRLGYPSIEVKPTYGPMLAGFLKGNALPKEYRDRAKARQGLTYLEFENLALRAKIVTIGRWGIHNTFAIHYEQRRPIDGINHPYQLPLHTDCSGFVTLCYKWAGAPDPNGRGYDGLGYTGTLLSYMRPIMKSQVRIGDVVVWGSFPGHHTALVIDEGFDPLLVSHGQENDPREIRFSVESRYQPSHVTWLRLPEWS